MTLFRWFQDGSLVTESVAVVTERIQLAEGHRQGFFCPTRCIRNDDSTYQCAACNSGCTS